MLMQLRQPKSVVEVTQDLVFCSDIYLELGLL